MEENYTINDICFILNKSCNYFLKKKKQTKTTTTTIIIIITTLYIILYYLFNIIVMSVQHRINKLTIAKAVNIFYFYFYRLK